MDAKKLNLTTEHASRLYVALVELTAELARQGNTPAELHLDAASTTALQKAFDALTAVEMESL